MKNLVVLASGEGSNFQAILDNLEHINGKIVALIVDRECNAVKRAEDKGIPVVRIIRKECGNKQEFHRKLLEAMIQSKGDYFILAGFMSILSPEIVNEFENRIVNIHPSLLPAFPGVNSIKQAFDYGVKYTGCTVHFVDSGVDTGPIIDQKVVPVLCGFNLQRLAEEIHKAEHDIYPKVIKEMCSEGFVVEDGKVVKGEKY